MKHNMSVYMRPDGRIYYRLADAMCMCHARHLRIGPKETTFVCPEHVGGHVEFNEIPWEKDIAAIRLEIRGMAEMPTSRYPWEGEGAVVAIPSWV